MGFLDNTGVARLWQHILVKVNERLTVDPSAVEEGAANLINADSLGGVLAKDYALKEELNEAIKPVDPTLTQEGLAAESKATGTRITALENNKVESINGLTGKNITLDVMPSSPNHIEFATTDGIGYGGYIDFHFNGSNADFTSRIIEDGSGILNLNYGCGVKLGSIYTPPVLVNDDINAIVFSTVTNTQQYALIQSLPQTNQLRFVQKNGGESVWANNEHFYLPAPDLSRTGQYGYEILTTKSAVTVAQGGTGAADAATARINLGITPQNIGALPLTGGTLTGQLSAESLAIRTSGAYPQLQYYPAGLTACSGKVQQNNGNRTFVFAEYHSDQDAASARYCEQYYLPAPDAGLTANKTYNILTSKAAVTIAQGGTGATTLKGARTNLMIDNNFKTTTVNSNDYVGIFAAETPSTANGSNDPTGGVLLTAQVSTYRGMQLANGYSANSLKWRFLHTDQTSDAGVKGYSPWYTIYHSGNINTLMTEITNRLSNASGVSF